MSESLNPINSGRRGKVTAKSPEAKDTPATRAGSAAARARRKAGSGSHETGTPAGVARTSGTASRTTVSERPEDGAARDKTEKTKKKAGAEVDGAGGSKADDSAADQEKWHKVSARLRTIIGVQAWKTWIRPVLGARRARGGVLVIDVTSSVARENINSKFADKIRAVANDEFGAIKSVNVRVVSATAARMSQQRISDEVEEPEARKEREALGSKLDEKLTFENFIIGDSNQMAEAAARRTAKGGRDVANPLFLFGGVGLGKTHLMHAIAWQIRKDDRTRKVMYVTAEKFMNRFVDAIRHKDTAKFKQQFRSVDVLLIDDFQFIAGKESTQDEFFHTFNALVEQGNQVVVSADKSPNDIDKIDERLRSRLGFGMVADITPADYELRLGILRSKAELAGMSVPDSVMEFLANRINSNVRELEGALHRIQAHCDVRKREITVEAAGKLLADLLQASSRKAVTVEQIQTCTATYYNVRMTEMKSKRRSHEVARARQVAMYLCKELTNLSFPKIGSDFGGRDHTTVMYAVRTIRGLMGTDSRLAEDVKNLLNKLDV